MPQMMPMNWIFLFIYFLTIFFMFNLMNYFSINHFLTKNKSNNLKSILIHWKW